MLTDEMVKVFRDAYTDNAIDQQMKLKPGYSHDPDIATRSALEAVAPMIRDAALQEAIDFPPSTAENPHESSYEHGYFQGVMAYGKFLRRLKSSDTSSMSSNSEPNRRA